MDKLGLKEGTKKCLLIAEHYSDEFNRRIEESNYYEDIDMLEIRADYLLNNYNDIAVVNDIINNAIKKVEDKKVLVTVRTFKEGGNCYLDAKNYTQVMKYLFEKSKADAFDIEYNFYSNNKKTFDSFITYSKKTIIFSYHEFTDNYNRENVEKLLMNMAKTDCDMAKLAIFVNNKDKVLDLMNLSKEVQSKINNSKKYFTVIALGKLGVLSRVYHEYNNNRIVYINDDLTDIDNNGQFNVECYYELRNILKK